MIVVRRNLLFSFVIGCMLASAATASSTALRKYLRDLDNRKEATRTQAEAAILAAGELGMKALLDYLNTQGKSYREAAVAFLGRTATRGASLALLERAFSERSDELRAQVLKLLRERRADGAIRSRLLAALESDSASERKKAAGIALAMRDAWYVDELMKRFTKQLAEQKSGGVGVNASVSRVSGHDTYQRTYVLRGRNGPQRVTQNIRMPIISGTGVSTYTGLPAGQALVTLTGKSFGTDLDKWRAWHKGYRP